MACPSRSSSILVGELGRVAAEGPGSAGNAVGGWRLVVGPFSKGKEALEVEQPLPAGAVGRLFGEQACLEVGCAHCGDLLRQSQASDRGPARMAGERVERQFQAVDQTDGAAAHLCLDRQA